MNRFKAIVLPLLTASIVFSSLINAHAETIGGVHNQKDAISARKFIKNEIFGSQTNLSHTKIVHKQDFCLKNVQFLYCQEWDSRFAVEVFDVHMEKGMVSRIFEITPKNYENTVFWLRGHYEKVSDYSPRFFLNIDAMLANGSRVFVFSMPFMFPNAPNIDFDHPLFGKLLIGSSHNELSLMQNYVIGSPLKFFVQPELAILDKLIKNSENVAVAGLSGGGWTATLLAAIEPRIKLTYSIAGTQAFPVKSEVLQDLGDWEQWLPGISSKYGYLDLYILGSYPNRKLVNVYNSNDPCCYSVRPGSLRWVKSIVYRSNKLGGDFSVKVEESSSHDFGPEALASFLKDLRALK